MKKQILIDNMIKYGLLVLVLCFCYIVIQTEEEVIVMLSFVSCLLCFIAFFLYDIKVVLRDKFSKRGKNE